MEAAAPHAFTSGFLAEFLARGPFAAASARGAALVVGEGDPPRVAFATPAALATFGVKDLAALDAVLFDAASPGARRLRHLMNALPLGGAPRLESLRFFVGRLPIPVGWLCARIAGPDGAPLLVAAAPVRASDSLAAQTAETPEPETSATVSPIVDDPFTPPPIDGPVRFLWATDDEGKFDPPDAAVAARLGPHAPRTGETAEALRARIGFDSAEFWASALAAHLTFSGLRLAWPEPGHGRARVALVSGAPKFDRDRKFSGFRGFGVFTGESAELAHATAEPAVHERHDPPAVAYEEHAPVAATAPEAVTHETEAPSTVHLQAMETSDHLAPEASRSIEPSDAVAPDEEHGLALAIGPHADTTERAIAAEIEHSEPKGETNSTPPPEIEAPIAEGAVSPADDLPVDLAHPFVPESQRETPAPPELASPDSFEASPAALAEGLDGPPVPVAESKDETPLTPPRMGREGGAEIFVFRPAGTQGPPNVVPIRPSTPGALAPTSPEPEPPRVAGDSVELTSQERDAFKEIARALGVRPRAPRGEVEGADPAEPSEAIVAPVAASSEPNVESAQHDLAALLDHLPIGALVMRAGEAVYLNQTLLDLVGYANLDEFRARDGLKHIFRGRDPETLAPAGDGGGMPLETASGEFMTVDAQARPISWAGAPAVLMAVRRSRETEHNAELRALELEVRRHATATRELSAALDVAVDGMVRLDSTGRLLGMNPRAEALFGYDQKEAAGESFLMLLAPASQAEATAALDRVVRADSLTPQGEGLDVVARDHAGHSLPARLEFGRLTHLGTSEYFALLRDLTHVQAAQCEREAARETAEKESARKTDFLARVSHEIRTPLHAILGFAEVIMEERFGPIGNERYKDYIKDIHTSGKHVMSLANDLLDLAKIEAGKMELQFAPVDANRIIRESVALMQPQAARARIIMRLSLFDKLPNVMADERSLRQIMLNLMSNAVKFNEPGGQVIISTALDESGHSVIRVRDTGIGMNESELGIALEPFRRLPGGRRQEGTGLGLPLTKALVEANHADFSIKSRKEHGTLVEVAFPGAQAAQ